MSEPAELSVESCEIIYSLNNSELDEGRGSTIELSRESLLTYEENVNSQENTPSPGRDTDYTVNEVCQNPEPPKELADLINADNIGGTVFSKHWLFTTLMKLLEVVEQQEKHEGNDAINTCFDLDEDLQDNLCKLWDMSMNQEVVNFLVEFKAVELLSGVIANSRAPRATEICVGILGNMACSYSVCQEISSRRKLLELLLHLLESPDAPTLVELTRLLHVCISRDDTSAALWITAIKEMTHVLPSILFILQSSTNAVLLKNTTEFVDKLMETDEDICIQWSTADLVLAVMEAVKQTGEKDSEECETYIHVLQLVSTSETGVQALVSYAGEVFMLIMRYLVHICVDDIVAVNDHLNIISSSFSVLDAVFGSWDGIEHYLVSDFQLLRCIVKILEVVYPKIKKSPIGIRLTPRKRSSSRVVSAEHEQDCSPARDQHDSNNSAECDADEVESRERGESVEESGLTCQELSSEVNCDDNSNTSTSDAKAAEFNNKMTRILYEVIQNLLIDILAWLEKLPVAEPECESVMELRNGDGEHRETTAAETTELSAKAYEDSDETSYEKPKSLVYLDLQCDRYRLQCLLHTLRDIGNRNLVATLYNIGLKHELHRLCRIVDETFPSHCSISS